MTKIVQQEGDSDQAKSYDAKKACWVPDEKEGYVLGEIKAAKGGEVGMNQQNRPS
jgi:hypothetical protein